MPQIIAWQCPHTKEIFTEKKKYLNHQKRYAAEQRRQKKYKAEKKEFFDWIDDEKTRILSIDEIVPWILKNEEKLTLGAIKYSSLDRHVYKGNTATNIKIDVTWKQSVPNTHSCPRGGVTNWGGMTKMPDGSSAPRGYPGWIGTVKGRYLGKKMNWTRPMYIILNLIGIHTAGGSGHSSGWHYGVEMFADDWPGLAQTHVFDKLSGTIPI